MATLAGGDSYFSKTLRACQWSGFEPNMRERAIEEAVSMIGRLSFAGTPPEMNLDNAAYEQAYCLLEESTAPSDAASAIAQGIRSRSIADASESYVSASERDGTPGWIGGVFYCPKALSWIKDWVYNPVKAGRYEVGVWT